MEQGSKVQRQTVSIFFVQFYSRHFPRDPYLLSATVRGLGRPVCPPPPRFISHTLLSMPHVGMRNPFHAFPKTHIRPPVIRCIFGYTVPADRAEPQSSTPC